MPCGWEGNRRPVWRRTGQWPCVIDNSGITTYGLMALGREMSTPPKRQEYGTLLPLVYNQQQHRQLTRS